MISGKLEEEQEGDRREEEEVGSSKAAGQCDGSDALRDEVEAIESQQVGR